ncbi:MAG: HlyD family efflux transporter periplasmic adaptor subunit [Actinobacteria bacterium]|nr:HlyD family efflux transporter periplasmic adaptor subunit [Actinomycetota bacterium]
MHEKKRPGKIIPAILIGVISVFVFMTFVSCAGGAGPFANNPSRNAQNQGIQTYKVVPGDILQEISTTGSVVSTEENSYTFEVSGEVISAIEQGQEFKKGDILVELDNSEGLNNIRQKEIDLQSVENDLANSKNSLANAKINYQSALDSNHIAIQLADINTRKSEESVRSALNSLENANASAELSYQSALLALQKIDVMEDYATTDQQEKSYEFDYESGQLNLKSNEVSSDSSKEQAESSYDNALLSQSSTYWTNLSSLQSAQKAIDLAQINISEAQLKISAAESSLELAQQDLDSVKEDLGKYKIVATYDGIVLSNDYLAGEDSQQNTGDITIISNNYLVSSSISENDISKVKAGNQVSVIFDAYQDLEFPGIVKKIIPVTTISDNGIVSFEILISFEDNTNAKIYYGLSASANIVVAKAENVLYVPIQSVYEENGKNYVDMLPAGQFENGKTEQTDLSQSVKKTEVTLGINDYANIEITSGLKEGDVIITSKIQDN